MSDITACPIQTGPSTAAVIVEEGWIAWRAEARRAFDSAQLLLREMSELDIAAVDVPLSFDVPDGVGQPINIPVDPISPDFVLNFPVAPVEPSLPTVPATSFGSPPAFDAMRPDVNLPAPPATLDATPPGDAPTLTDVVLPTVPELVQPDFPSLYAITLPDSPTLNIPSFSATPPSSGDIVAPGETFFFTEPGYSSDQLDRIREEIAEFFANNGGLPPEVWNAIWNRARTNEQRTAMQEINGVTEEWASRGFSLPQGALDMRILQSYQNLQNAENTLNREITIEQARMARENLQFAITQGIALENLLGQLYDSQMERALKAEQISFEAAISIYNAKIALFNAQLQAYQVEAEVYKARIEAELAQVELFRAQIQGQQAIGQLNLQLVEVYKARIEALTIQVEIYNSQVRAVVAQTEVDKNRVDAFRAMVEAYGERVRAKTAEYEGYTAHIRGEVSKIELYSADVQAFGERVNAYKTETEAKATETRARLDQNEAVLQVYKARTEAYAAQVGAEGDRILALAAVFSSRAQIFDSQVRGEVARVESDTTQIRLTIDRARIEATLRLEQARISIEQMQRITELELEQLKTIAQVESQIAASTLSAVNLSAGLSSNTSHNTGCTTSFNHNEST